MHRRARHLNPGSAGATLTMDSRFMTGLSDGDPVSTWTDRSGSGNNATGSGAARPTYQTNEHGGQPALQFYGAQVLIHPLSIGSSPYTFLGVFTGTGAYGGILVACSPSTQLGVAIYARNSSTNWGTFLNADVNSSYSAASVTRIGTVVMRNGSAANGVDLVTDGIVETKTGSGFYGGDGRNRRTIGAGDSIASYLTGKIYTVTAIPGGIQPPLRRRLEHAAAFAFKIPCS